jgi:hypothetical protein
LSNNATSNTVLSIANSNVVVYSSNYTSNYSSNYTSNYTSNVVTEQYTAAATPTFSIGGPSTSDSITSSIDKFMIFTNANINNTFTVPAGGLNCDILMIGGGSSGQTGGGGAGACIVAINQTLPAGSCVVNVGGGGGLGGDSYITVGGNDRYRAKGGGNSPVSEDASGNSGGCGGGAARNINLVSGNGGSAVQTNVVNGSTATIGPSITSTYAVMGNAGGGSGTAYNSAGGGGGIGNAGGTGGGNGGDGAYQVTLTGAATPINFRGYFANGSTSFGVQHGSTGNYYIGGGGGGLSGGNRTNGGLGGGGGANSGFAGGTNTGSGGAANNNNGGTGIIIIRYRSPLTTTTTPTTITVPITTTLTTTATAQATTLGTPSIELIRGIAGDNNLDYKLGNYDGNFKIMSSISNTDTDRLALTSGGNLMLTNNSTNSTALSIINSNVIVGSSNYTSNVVSGSSFIADFSGVGNTAPSVHELVSGSTTERIMIFRTATSNHTFTVPAGGLNCDILMIGGGGTAYGGGGGGAGACIVAINQTLPAGSCVVNVGRGGRGLNDREENGLDSFIQVDNADRYRAKGGGASGYSSANSYSGFPGGCGGGVLDSQVGVGGAAVSTNVVNGVIENTPPRITSTYAVMGNSGASAASTKGGSGGGIGTAGTVGGNGGNGAYQVTLTTSPTTTINFRNYFANGSTSFGVQDGSTTNYYIGGGGAGYDSTTGGWKAGGLGGGGSNAPLGYGVSNTGGGGGSNSGGGSGIIIIRYRSVTTTTTPTTITVPATLGTPSIELIRGIAGDNNLDYKLGNYEGNFKIMSSISNSDTDRLSITSSGNINILNNSTNSTALSIINSNIVVAATPTTGGAISAISVTGTTAHTSIGTTDRFMIFTANGSFTVPTGGIVCDILMIGGGGAGGYAGGGGGGAGACIVAINQTLSTTGTYTVNVGAGDVASGTAAGAGGDSTIGLNGGATLYIAKGGGRGESQNNGRNNGGCGGGSGYASVKTGGLAVNTNMVAGTLVDANARGATFAVFGNKGGDRPDSSSGVTGVGGGGIGGAGGNHITSTPANLNAGPGGVGLFQATVGGTTYNFRSYFANNGNPYNFGALNSVDSQYYIGGGGGGSVQTCTKETGPNVGGRGGVGGGGAGGITTTFNPSTGASAGAVNPTAGAANTGSGGGGGWFNNAGTVQSGGSGIVIIRYRAPPATVGVPSVELVRGIAGDSNHDYKVGNYDGNFKIMSAVSGAADTERLNITTTGNVGIGTSSPANELHIFDSTTSATSLIIQNNNMMITSNITQGTSTSTTGNFTQAATPSFTTGGPSSSGIITSSIDKFMIFTTTGVNHTFTIPAGGLSCDILMIGGGGSDQGGYGGGGAGACIVAINQTLPAGSTCVLRVGAGGIINTNGEDSFIKVDNADRYRAKGGGHVFQAWNTAGSNGGCGSGGGYNNGGNGGIAVSTNVITLSSGLTSNIGPCLSSTFAVMGNAGGNSGSGGAGGGGGIGTAGVTQGKGGDGAYQVTLTGAETPINFRAYFANGSTSFGVQDGTTGNYYIGGGGGGHTGSTYAPNGLGVGSSSYGYGGQIFTGGSGIIIIRYRSGTSTTTYTHTPTITTTLSTPTLGTPSIELVRGTQGDSNTDYKIGNYNGDFIVKSSVSGVDTDYIRIVGTSASIFNSTASPQWSTVSDRRIKENIERASYDKCYDTINKLELYRFNYIKELNSINKDKTQLGYIAQEVNDVFPKAVSSYEFNNTMLSIPDLLSIDVAQINYSLYGAVKKLIEINNNKELRLKKLECLLNIESDGGSSSDSSNVVISDSDVLSSNVVIIEDLLSSNVVIEDTMTSNVVIEDTMTSNVVIIEDTMTSNVVIEDVLSSNVVIIDDTMSSNVVIEDVLTSNVVIIEDVLTSNVVIIEDVLSSNVVVEDTNNI